MNCSDIAETLDNRNVEELGTSERRDIEAHLAACPTCARDWELHKAFSALTDMQEPAGFPADCRALIAAGADRSHDPACGWRICTVHDSGGGFSGSYQQPGRRRDRRAIAAAD